MAILTKNQLSASNASSFPDNTTGAITPQVLRDFNTGVIDTLVDSLNTGSYAITTGSNDFTQANSFTSISASSFVSASEFVGDGSKLTNITASVAIPISDEGILQGYATQLNFSGSNISASLNAGIATISVNTNNLVTTSSFNSYTSSNDSKVNSLISATASYANSASVAAVDAAQQSQINSLIASTSSFALTSLNAFTASQETKDATLELYTASVDQKFTTIGGQSGSWDNTSLNSFTASQNTKNSTLATYTASLNTSITSLNTYTASNDTKWSNLGSQSGSWITESETSSFARTNVTNVFTADQTFTSISASGDIKGNSFQGGAARVDTLQTQIPANPGDLTILIPNGKLSVSSSISATGTFTSSLQQGYVWVGDGNNRTTLVATSSFAGTPTDITSLNAFTASQDTKNTTLANVTSSLNASTASQQSQIDNLIAATGSYITTPLTSLNSFTASQDTKNSTLATYTASVDTKFSTLGTQSGSWITESETASFARTNVDNNFSVNQTFTNITAVSASFTYVQTTYETSSVIYSSGSNQFGDELSDIQTLSGSVKVQGTLTINGLPVATGSTDISSLNAFTASQETKNSTLATYTASVDSQLSSLTNATASYAISSSVAAVDAAQQSQINSLIAATGSYITTPLTSLNAFTQSQDTKNSTLATYTASVDISLSNINSFTASNGNTSLNSYTASNDTKWSNLAGQTGSYVTSAITASSLVTASVNLNTITFTKGDASTFNIIVNTGSAVTTDITSLNSFTASQETKDTTLASVTSSLNSATASLFTSTSLSLVTASAVGNTITFTKGDTSTFAVSVSSTPIDTGSLVTTASFNAYTSSNDQRVSSLETNSASVNISISNINTATASLFTSTSLSLITASFDNGTRNLTFTKGDTSTFSVNIPDVSGSTSGFATLGANTFTGSQTISSSLNVSGSANFVGGDVNFTDQGRNINIDVDRTIIKGQKPTLISSSLDIQGSLTASLQQGYVWVGNATNHNVLVATSSFATNVSNLATTGSNSFNGNQTITGSLILSSSNAVELQVIGNSVFTGSAFGNVVALSITSNTASMDLNLGNYFTLTLADTATTHISASNVQPGVSATLVITTGTNSSASLAPTMLQPSGSAYSATNGSAKKDVLSIVAVASGVPFVVSTKNMI